MKIPVWVWDWKLKKYLVLPPGLMQFDDGKWGFTSAHENEMHDFYYEHSYLFRLEPENLLVPWKRAVLRHEPGPKKYQPNKDKAKISRVLR